MLYSQLVGKTKKEAPKDETSLNAQLLIRAGFIQKEMAGVYVFLPLGLKVLQNIINIIREEMNAIGGQELLMSSLQNPELWKKTDRWNDEVLDIWFKTKLKNGVEVGLGTTHEEPIASLMSKYVNSYKDLPLYAYQFQTKFRNETRARSGLLRTREFIMKDLYSFNKTQEELEQFYELAKQAYVNCFTRVGIGEQTFITFASGGVFSKYSHEFQTICPTGEDTVYLSKEKRIAVNKEVYTEEVLKELGLKKSDMEEVRAIEVGNIFKLGTRYSAPLGLTYTDVDGTQKPVVMGSYGIGPARVMATIVELFNDANGIIWPENVSPYKVHLIGLNLEDAETKTKAFNLYEHLKSKDIEVLFDDRQDVTAGAKFSDADLIGITNRIVISKKTGDNVELKKRKDSEHQAVSAEKVSSLL